MQLPRTVAILLLAGAFSSFAAAAQSPSMGSYPIKPLKIVASNPGGTSDLLNRLVVQAITADLGQPAVIINRPGSQITPAMEVARATPDGYTLMSLGANQFWLLPFLQDNVPYDPVRDFATVTLTATAPNMVAVNASVQATSIKELIALARAKPGTLNYAIGNYGGSPHLAGELFKALSKTNIVTVPYTGTPRGLAGLMGGEVQLMFPTVGTGMPGVKSGHLRALAVTTEKPTALAPGLPTVNESGLPGYETSVAYAVFVPAKTPSSIIALLNRAIVRYIQAPDLKDKLFAAGLEIVASSPPELAAAMKRDRSRMGKVIQDAGIRSEN